MVLCDAPLLYAVVDFCICAVPLVRNNRIQVMGVYRAMSGSGDSGSASGVFRTVIISNNIKRLARDSSVVTVTPQVGIMQ